MMSSLIFLTIMLLNLEGIIGSVGKIEFNPEYFTKNNINDAHCFANWKDIGKMQRNETKRIMNECMSASCQDDRSIAISGCAPVEVQPPCHIGPGNILKPFPECCYELVCPEPDKRENYL